MTTSPARQALQIAHSSPGRLRVRLPALRADRAAAETVADTLADLDGVIDVAVRPRTGSVLCRYDPRRMDEHRLLAALHRQTRAALARRPDESPPAATRRRGHAGSSIGRELGTLFRTLDSDIADATGGRLDLGTLASLGLLGAGATEIAVTRTIPAPPWFSLAWWAFRTFAMFEHSSDAKGGRRPSGTTRAIRAANGGG
jgi:hypothetical protein